MTVVIVDINKKTLEKSGLFNNNKESNHRLLSLHEYIKIAKKTIGKFASPSVASEMLRNEDAISFVTNHLIQGTLRWKADGGRTLYSYLNQCAIWSIQRWIFNTKAAKKTSTLSLDKSIDDDGNTMYNLVANDDTSNDGTDIEEILSKGNLNETQKTCLRMKFVEGMTYRAIGAALNKTGSRIEQIVTAALQKIRNEYKVTDLAR
jgi:RNA polymerase sigma factor (sigma-70 family)